VSSKYFDAAAIHILRIRKQAKAKAKAINNKRIVLKRVYRLRAKGVAPKENISANPNILFYYC